MDAPPGPTLSAEPYPPIVPPDAPQRPQKTLEASKSEIFAAGAMDVARPVFRREVPSSIAPLNIPPPPSEEPQDSSSVKTALLVLGGAAIIAATGAVGAWAFMHTTSEAAPEAGTPPTRVESPVVATSAPEPRPSTPTAIATSTPTPRPTLQPRPKTPLPPPPPSTASQTQPPPPQPAPPPPPSVVPPPPSASSSASPNATSRQCLAVRMSRTCAQARQRMAACDSSQAGFRQAKRRQRDLCRADDY